MHLCLSVSAALYWNHHPIWSKLFGEEESRLFFDLPNSGWDVNRDEPRFPFLKRWPHTTKYKLVIRVEHPGFLGNPFNFMAFSMKVLISFLNSSKKSMYFENILYLETDVQQKHLPFRKAMASQKRKYGPMPSAKLAEGSFFVCRCLGSCHLSNIIFGVLMDTKAMWASLIFLRTVKYLHY